MPQYNGVEFNEDVQSKSGAVYMFHGGKAYAVPELAGSSIAMPLTSSPLGASATFTSPVRDRFSAQTAVVSYAKVGDTILNSDGVSDYSNLTLNGGISNVSVPTEQVATLGTTNFTT